MRRVWTGIGLLGVLVGSAGCTRDQLLRPPKQPEEFASPPPEKRYLNPPQPPLEYLNQDSVPRSVKDGDSPANPSGPMGNRTGPGGRVGP
jgi:hypothetical protein